MKLETLFALSAAITLCQAYDDSEKILEGRAPNIKTVKNPTVEDKEENGEEQKSSSNRREQILTLVKQLRNMKSDD